MKIVPKKKNIKLLTKVEKKAEYNRLKKQLISVEDRINVLATDLWGGAGPDCKLMPEGVRRPTRIKLIREDAGVSRTVNINTHAGSEIDEMLERCMKLARG